MLRDEAFRLDGDWVGAMAYLDDEGNPVVFSEEAEVTQEGANVQGIVRSRWLAGNARHDNLSGTWFGTHRGGVRRGFFKWHNTRRDGESNGVEFDLEATIAALVDPFILSLKVSYNDVCRVASWPNEERMG